MTVRQIPKNNSSFFLKSKHSSVAIKHLAQKYPIPTLQEYFRPSGVFCSIANNLFFKYCLHSLGKGSWNAGPGFCLGLGDEMPSKPVLFLKQFDNWNPMPDADVGKKNSVSFP
jgi:hypothetical protein